MHKTHVNIRTARRVWRFRARPSHRMEIAGRAQLRLGTLRDKAECQYDLLGRCNSALPASRAPIFLGEAQGNKRRAEADHQCVAPKFSSNVLAHGKETVSRQSNDRQFLPQLFGRGLKNENRQRRTQGLQLSAMAKPCCGGCSVPRQLSLAASVGRSAARAVGSSFGVYNSPIAKAVTRCGSCTDCGGSADNCRASVSTSV
jgi:hypothetical protein